MTFQITKSEVGRLGFDLAVAVAQFKFDIAAHATSQGVAAPVAHPLVDTIVRVHDGQFVEVNDPPEVVAAEAREARRRLTLAVAEDARARAAAVLSPARLLLAQLDQATISAKPVEERTAQEGARLSEIGAAFGRIEAINRHAVLLMIEIEDGDDISTWRPHSWPEA